MWSLGDQVICSGLTPQVNCVRQPTCYAAHPGQVVEAGCSQFGVQIKDSDNTHCEMQEIMHNLVVEFVC